MGLSLFKILCPNLNIDEKYCSMRKMINKKKLKKVKILKLY
jgi:hypothetical protein